MKINQKYIISKDAKELFDFSEEEEVSLRENLISFKFLSEIECLLTEEGSKLKKNEIAKKLNTSASYITQIFRGDKLINIPLIAKFEKAFDITFEIKAKKNNEIYGANKKQSNISLGSKEMNTISLVYSRYNYKSTDYNDSDVAISNDFTHTNIKIA